MFERKSPKGWDEGDVFLKLDNKGLRLKVEKVEWKELRLELVRKEKREE